MASESGSVARFPGLGELTYREAHAFIDGFYAGSRWGYHQNTYGQEAHYWRAGYLTGTLSRYALLYKVYKELTNNET